MSNRSSPLTDRQRDVLAWVAAGCPAREWQDETHKHTARALQSRGLVAVSRRNRVWTATITEEGCYYLEHGKYRTAMEPQSTPGEAPPAQVAAADPQAPPLDSTARAMRRVARREKPAGLVLRAIEIKEVYMKYKVVVTRVQVAERFVRATTEADAAATVQAEFDRPYGYFGSWKTTSSEIDVIEAEQTTVIGPTALSIEGPLLLPLKDAAKALGISYSMIYQLVNQGDIEHVVIGTRKFVSREALLSFIDENTHRGYYRAR